jgi:hypothetical protein
MPEFIKPIPWPDDMEGLIIHNGGIQANWLGNATAPHTIQDTYKALYGKKYPPAPKVKGETLELNIAAKKPDPFTKLKSAVEALEARNMGRLLVYTEGKQVLAPTKTLNPKDWPILVSDYHVCVHNSTRVRVYVPVMDMMDGRIFMWHGMCVEDWVPEPAYKLLAPMAYITIEEGVICEF